MEGDPYDGDSQYGGSQPSVLASVRVVPPLNCRFFFAS